MDKLIQIVEDDGDIRFIVSFVLEDAGYVVETFENAQTFLNRKRREDVDLVILDVMLPDGNGIELCKQLKEQYATSKIPVIIMSAHANLENVLQEGNADDFISKPFDIDRFAAKVNNILAIG